MAVISPPMRDECSCALSSASAAGCVLMTHLLGSEPRGDCRNLRRILRGWLVEHGHLKQYSLKPSFRGLKFGGMASCAGSTKLLAAQPILQLHQHVKFRWILLSICIGKPHSTG